MLCSTQTPKKDGTSGHQGLCNVTTCGAQYPHWSNPLCTLCPHTWPSSDILPGSPNSCTAGHSGGNSCASPPVPPIQQPRGYECCLQDTQSCALSPRVSSLPKNGLTPTLAYSPPNTHLCEIYFVIYRAFHVLGVRFRLSTFRVTNP